MLNGHTSAVSLGGGSWRKVLDELNTPDHTLEFENLDSMS